MFENKRACAGCGRVIGWTENAGHFSDNRMVCVPCLLRANLCEPPVGAKPHPWQSSKVVARIKEHDLYDAFCNKPGTKILLNGRLLVNTNDQTFAIGCNDDTEMMIGFQPGSYANVEDIGVSDGVQTKSIKVSEGDSGAATGVLGGLVFGPLGALAGALGTRTGAQYQDYALTENIGFSLTYKFGARVKFNVLKACFNYDFLNFEDQKTEYEEVKDLTIQICEELYKLMSASQPNTVPSAQQTDNLAEPAQQVSNININPSNVEPTITRIELFLEDQEWGKARAYADAALDYFPTDYRLYLSLLCADMKVTSPDKLKECGTPFKDNPNYKKVVRFADQAIVDNLEKSENVGDKSAMAEMPADGQDAMRVDGLGVIEKKADKEYNLPYILGEYKAILSPRWQATQDHVTYKNKDYYYKDMESFKAVIFPSQMNPTGQLHFRIKGAKRVFILVYNESEMDRALEFTEYVNDKMNEL